MSKLVWYGGEGGRLGWPACPQCFEKMGEYGVIEACASVGIEHGKSTGEMLRNFIEDYHASGHRDE